MEPPRSLDLSGLVQICAGNQRLQQSILEEFLRVTPNLVDSLERSSQAKDGEAVKRLAHHLMSSSRTVGAMRLGDLCASIESEENQEKLTELAEAASEEFRKVSRSILETFQSEQS